MKEKQDIEQQILDAIDSSAENTDEQMEALLDSEEGLDFLCDINDLDEAANRKWGKGPDVDAAWKSFGARHIEDEDSLESKAQVAYMEDERPSRIFQFFRYAVASVAVLLVIVAFFMRNHSQANKQVLAQTETPSALSSNDVPLADTSVKASVNYKTITIEAGEQKTVVLPDGTEVCLNAKSSLKYPENFGKDNRDVEFYGEGYFKVHHDASLPFIIKTHTVSTKVLGTEFNLRCYNNEDVHVTLVQGSVEVSLHNNKVKIAPNEDAYVENGQVLVQHVNPKDFTSWKDGILYFDNASLRTILQQLGRVYNVSIVCNDEHLLNRHFHYMCNMKDSLENALKLLNESSEINVKLRDNVIVLE